MAHGASPKVTGERNWYLNTTEQNKAINLCIIPWMCCSIYDFSPGKVTSLCVSYFNCWLVTTYEVEWSLRCCVDVLISNVLKSESKSHSLFGLVLRSWLKHFLVGDVSLWFYNGFYDNLTSVTKSVNTHGISNSIYTLFCFMWCVLYQWVSGIYLPYF